MNSIRTKLLLWYVGSLIITSLFFWFVIHEYAFHHGIELFVALVLLLSTIGFIIIYRFVQSITELTYQMQLITDKNLDARVPYTESNDEVSTMAQAFNALLSRLHEAFQREQQFLADVAHELKTPLATMKSSLEIALQNKNNEEYKRMLKEVNRLSDTVKDVLDLAWTESPEVHAPMKKIDVSALVQDIGEIAEKMASQKKLTVYKHIVPGVTIMGHKDKLARALLNLVDNAIKYTEKGSITISLRKDHTQVIITINDTGIGISNSEELLIFNRFYRGKRTDSILGSGLGLAITKSIVALHRGTISVTSKEGKGSTFTIILNPDISS